MDTCLKPQDRPIAASVYHDNRRFDGPVGIMPDHKPAALAHTRRCPDSSNLEHQGSRSGGLRLGSPMTIRLSQCSGASGREAKADTILARLAVSKPILDRWPSPESTVPIETDT